MENENLEGQARVMEEGFFEEKGMGVKPRPGICIFQDPFYVVPASAKPHDPAVDPLIVAVNKSYPPVLEKSPFWVLLRLGIRGVQACAAFRYNYNKKKGIRSIDADLLTEFKKGANKIYGLQEEN